MRCRVAYAAAVALAVSAVLAGTDVPGGRFDIETLAPGVYVFRNATAGFPGTNSVVVVRADGVLVVGAQPAPSAARALLESIAATVKAPVRYLVLTEPHAISSGGASAFPHDTIVLASGRARARLADPAYDFGAETRARAGASGWVEPARPAPTVYFDGPVTLDDPKNAVVLIPLPPAHSYGDLSVEIPSASAIILGGVLTSDRNPFGGDANVQGWVAVLNDLQRGDIRTFVPAAGPAVTLDEIRRLRDALAWTRGRVQQAFLQEVPREKIIDTVLADPTAALHFDLATTPAFARSIVQRVFAEALDARRRRGLP